MENETATPMSAAPADKKQEAFRVNLIFETASALGNILKQDPRLIRMEETRKAYESSAELNALLTEYEAQNRALEAAASDSSFDSETMRTVQERANDLYNQIMNHPVYQAVTEAQDEVNALMEDVNNTIMFAITGEMPANCSHDCSTCGGCC